MALPPYKFILVFPVVAMPARSQRLSNLIVEYPDADLVQNFDELLIPLPKYFRQLHHLERSVHLHDSPGRGFKRKCWRLLVLFLFRWPAVSIFDDWWKLMEIPAQDDLHPAKEPFTLPHHTSYIFQQDKDIWMHHGNLVDNQDVGFNVLLRLRGTVSDGREEVVARYLPWRHGHE
ncbi:hypothetical protein BDZ88DRAFT_119361 [Geranomyces variabilis]|nr:hypothetical protein BDZ88DRAFT_119361 [Geranomyces variabilis]